jgi:hypothetical protein
MGYTKVDTSTLVTSSGWRNKSQAAQGGVGLLLDRKARKSLLKVVPSKNGKILVTEFDGNPRITIIVIYAPTNCAKESVKREFYTELRNVLQDVPTNNFLAIMGDFNARLVLGTEHVPHPFHEQTEMGTTLLKSSLNSDYWQQTHRSRSALENSVHSNVEHPIHWYNLTTYLFDKSGEIAFIKQKRTTPSAQ